MHGSLTCQGNVFEEHPVAVVSSIATKQKVGWINYRGTLAVLWHSLFAMSWSLLGLSIRKRPWVHADMICKPAQDSIREMTLAAEHNKKHFTREAGWSVSLPYCLHHSFQSIYNILDWLSVSSRWCCTISRWRKMRQRWEPEMLPRIQLDSKD